MYFSSIFGAFSLLPMSTSLLSVLTVSCSPAAQCKSKAAGAEKRKENTRPPKSSCVRGRSIGTPRKTFFLHSPRRKRQIHPKGPLAILVLHYSYALPPEMSLSSLAYGRGLELWVLLHNVMYPFCIVSAALIFLEHLSLPKGKGSPPPKHQGKVTSSSPKSQLAHLSCGDTQYELFVSSKSNVEVQDLIVLVHGFTTVRRLVTNEVDLSLF